jgi:hypothetical protein
VGAYCEQVILALKPISQLSLTHGHLAKVLLDVQQLLACIHTLPLACSSVEFAQLMLCSS